MVRTKALHHFGSNLAPSTEHIMASKTLQIQNAYGGQHTSRMILTLFAINGVNSVDFEPEPNRVKVVFDDEVISPPQLFAVFQDPGKLVPAAPPARKKIQRCGICGD